MNKRRIPLNLQNHPHHVLLRMSSVLFLLFLGIKLHTAACRTSRVVGPWEFMEEPSQSPSRPLIARGEERVGWGTQKQVVEGDDDGYI